jgi:hypothetical protein
MRAQIKRFYSPDIDLESFVPTNHTKVGFLLQIMVGPENEVGEESFDVTVCTPGWLQEHYANQAVVPLRHHLLIQDYNYHSLTTSLRQLVERCVGDSWKEIAQQVGKIGQWEFEEYSA